MSIYLCRWPKGEFSIVHARSKRAAIEMLDEWGNAEKASLSLMADCMFDFQLGDDGQSELAHIGELTHDFIMKTCYPDRHNTVTRATLDEFDDIQLDYSEEG